MDKIYLSYRQDWLLFFIKHGFKLKHKDLNYNSNCLLEYGLINPKNADFKNFDKSADPDNEIYIITKRGIQYLSYSFKNFVRFTLFNFITILIAFTALMVSIFY